MSVRMIHSPSIACAETVAQLDERITVAKTEQATVLLNLPRDIDAIAEKAKPKSFMQRLRESFGGAAS